MHRPSVARVLLASAFALPCAAAEWPQDPPAVTAPVAPGPEAEPESQQEPPPLPAQGPLDAITQKALERLAEDLARKRTERESARARNDLEAVAALDQEIRELGWQFGGLASRLDVQHFEAPKKRQFDLQQELEQLVLPLVQTLNEATEEPRQVADMKARIKQLEQRQRTVEEALRGVERTRDQLPVTSPARAEARREIEERWRPTLDAVRGELLVLRARLQAKEQNQQSLFESVSETGQKFVQSSGINVLLSVAVFLGVFLGLRFLIDRVLRRRRPERGLSLRLLEVTLQTGCLLLAIAATLAVPYVRNDWLLLAVGIVFLIGAGWALVKMLPQFVEQIRLVLNIGAVREGERVLVDGLPYRVDALRFYSRLHNPDLEGGNLRVPIKFLIGMRSRRSAVDEPWFPCRSGDVVLLADGQFGTVRQQTPEVVVLEHYGTQRSYATEQFLEQTPRNLSRGFAVRATVGIDYSHQKDAVQAIPERLRQTLQQGLAAEVGDGELKRVVVELAAAGSSSLDLQLIAEFAGSAAGRYLKLERRLQALFVAACNENGWLIPFPQLTLHRATE